MIVAANGRVKTTVTAEGPMTVVLQGLGPGAVTFDVRAPQGSVMAHGVLTTESSASCHTNGGEIRIEFAAGVEGGTVAYVLHTENGGTVTTIQL